MTNYVLDGQTPKLEPDILTWGRWFESADRKIARDQRGDVIVSTVFLGMEHGRDEIGQPLLFETMIFGGEHDQDQRRCATWGEAEAQHAAMVAEAFAAPHVVCPRCGHDFDVRGPLVTRPR